MPKIQASGVAPRSSELVPTPRRPSIAERAAERDVSVGIKLRSDYLAMSKKIQRLRALRLARDVSAVQAPVKAPKKVRKQASKASG